MKVVHFFSLYKKHIFNNPVKTPDSLGGLLRCTFVHSYLWYTILCWNE